MVRVGTYSDGDGRASCVQGALAGGQDEIGAGVVAAYADSGALWGAGASGRCGWEEVVVHDGGRQPGRGGVAKTDGSAREGRERSSLLREVCCSLSLLASCTAAVAERSKWCRRNQPVQAGKRSRRVRRWAKRRKIRNEYHHMGIGSDESAVSGVSK